MFENERAWFRSLNNEYKDRVIDLYEQILAVDPSISSFWDFISKRDSDIKELIDSLDDIKELIASLEENDQYNRFRKEREWFKRLSSKQQEKVIDVYDAKHVDNPYYCFWGFIKWDFIKEMGGDTKKVV